MLSFAFLYIIQASVNYILIKKGVQVKRKTLIIILQERVDICKENTFVGVSLLTLFRMVGVKKAPLPVFPCNFYKVYTSPQNILTFSFNPFATLL